MVNLFQHNYFTQETRQGQGNGGGRSRHLFDSMSQSRHDNNSFVCLNIKLPHSRRKKRVGKKHEGHATPTPKESRRTKRNIKTNGHHSQAMNEFKGSNTGIQNVQS